MNTDEASAGWVKAVWNNNSDYIWVIADVTNLHHRVPPPTRLWPLSNIMYNFSTYYICCKVTLPVESKLSSVHFQTCHFQPRRWRASDLPRWTNTQMATTGGFFLCWTLEAVFVLGNRGTDKQHQELQSWQAGLTPTCVRSNVYP